MTTTASIQLPTYPSASGTTLRAFARAVVKYAERYFASTVASMTHIVQK